MKLRVIDGERRKLENRVIKSMMRGQVCSEDLDRLKPWGNLSLVGSNRQAQSSDSEEITTHHSEDSVNG
tara:strand:- start:3 stop:209 length:207 start_codon:yes stop_codon:yes gene_type:complete